MTTTTVADKPWEGIFQTDVLPPDRNNIHCECCIKNEYSKYSRCPGSPSRGCGIYDDIIGTYLQRPEIKVKREEAERLAREKAEQKHKAELQRRFDDAAYAYLRNEGFISFGVMGASFNYNDMSWSYDAVRSRAMSFRTAE